ncbi:MAG: hypothetical protein EBR40_08115 [Proteobacteria bacterium]|nr:hypothetical protein [Pseudomonadota bacterium]
MDRTKISSLIGELSQAETDASYYFGRKTDNFNTRFCLWSGQSEDGRKHQGSLGKKPWPWEGASDTRIRLADTIINETVRLLKRAFFSSRMQVQPVETSDAIVKQAVQTALNWMMKVHCLDDLRREVELALQIRETFGLAFLGIFWRTTTRIEKKQITLEEIQNVALQGDGAAAALVEAILDPLQEESAKSMLAMLAEQAGTASAVRALREKGVFEYENPYIFESKPEWVALEPLEDILFPASTWSIQRAPWVARRELITEDELRERETTQDYDAEWVERAVKQKGMTQRINRNVLRNNEYLSNNDRDLIEVYHVYRKVHDKGATRVECTVLNTSITDLVAKHEISPYEHGQFPFIELPRERASRNLLESRGVPELVHTSQQEIKTQRDYRADRASIAILPPVRVPANRGKIELVFGPGTQIPERRPGEFGWMEPPPFDKGTIEVEQSTRGDVDEYFGRATAAIAPARTMLAQQDLVDSFLTDMKLAIAQTLQLMQQYLTDAQVQRIVGMLPGKFQLTREEVQGQYDLQVDFDVRDLDNEFLGKKLDYIAKVAIPLDVAGVIDRAGLVKFIMSAVDPVLGESLVRDAGVAAAAEAEDEQVQFAKIAAGSEPPLKEGGNPQVRLQVLQQTIQANPAVTQRYQQDEIFRKMIDARVQSFQFQLQQQQNAQIGRMGAVPALSHLGAA